MKKVIGLLCLLIGPTALHAQLSSVGGRLSLWGNADELTFSFVPEVEFELSEHWEVKLGIGVTTLTDLDYNRTTALGEVAPGVSYIIWGNEIVEFAIGAGGELLFDSHAQSAMIGLVPEIRFTPHEHLELGLSVGMLGAEWDRLKGWSGGIVLNSVTTGVSVAYKF